MLYSKFVKTVLAPGSVSRVRCYEHTIEINEDQEVFIDKQRTEFSSLEEARKHILQEKISKKLEEEISKEVYEGLSGYRVANIIKEHHDVKVTDTLIESYIKLASSNMFSVDPVVHQIRSLNKLDTIVEGKLHYILSDDSIVAIDARTQEFLNNLLQNQTEIVEYMRESKENFLSVLALIEG